MHDRNDDDGAKELFVPKPSGVRFVAKLERKMAMRLTSESDRSRDRCVSPREVGGMDDSRMTSELGKAYEIAAALADCIRLDCVRL